MSRGAIDGGLALEHVHRIVEEAEATVFSLNLARPGDVVVLSPSQVNMVWDLVSVSSRRLRIRSRPKVSLMSDGAWSLIVHGGARTIPPDLQAANRRGCLAAAERGAAILRRGGTALEAAEQAVRERRRSNL
jgi:hypothetical protein